MASWVEAQAASEAVEGYEQVTPDPKPQKRLREKRDGWDALQKKFAGHPCVSCGLAHQHLHHIAFRKADRGGDVLENLAPMCNSCHDRFHSHADRWEQIAAHIRAYVLARESRARYVIETMGVEKFARRYPEPVFLALGDLDRYREPDPWLRESGDTI